MSIVNPYTVTFETLWDQSMDKFTIQTFDDGKEKKEHLAQIFPYNTDQINELNKLGAGVFFCPNPQVNISARSIENTASFQCISLDMDVSKEKEDLSIDEIKKRKVNTIERFKTIKIKPNIIIETKNGLQPIWIFRNPLSLNTPNERKSANEYYKKLVEGFAEKTGLQSEGDNISRVVRLPDTLHLKNPDEPFRVKAYIVDTPKVTLQEFANEYFVENTDANLNTREQLRRLVGAGSSEGSRNVDMTRIIGSLLSRYPEEEWEEFCYQLVMSHNLAQNDPPLDEKELRKIFESIKKRQLFSIAMSKGESTTQWKEPVRVDELVPVDLDAAWIWERFLAKGFAAILSSIPKAGKTTLVTHLIKAIQHGEPFLDFGINHTNVLVVSEESESLWVERRDNLGLDNTLYISCRPLSSGMTQGEWVGYLENVRRFTLEKNIGLVIFDTLSTFMATEDEDKSAHMKKALLPVNKLLDANIAVLFIHHQRKSGGSGGRATRGSTAITGFFDIILEYDSDENRETFRKLSVLSRFSNTPKDLLVELTTKGFVSHGKVQEIAKAERNNNILSLLSAKENGLTIQEMIDLWSSTFGGLPPDKSTLSRCLNELESEGKTKRVGKLKKQGTPDIWAIAMDNGSKGNAKE